MVQVKNLSFAYEADSPILKEMSFSLKEGEKVGLIGANGVGKSTLMKLLLGLLFGTGEILVEGSPLTKNTLSVIRKKVGYILQNSDHQMFMPTVYEDMMFGLLNYGMPREEAEKKVDEVLKTLSMEDLKYRHNHKLSGGEKRMAAIATILAMEPKVLLMDEPTSALDPYNRRQMIRVIRGLPQTLLVASHDLDMIWDTCDRVLLLSEGIIVAQGTKEEILTNESLLTKYRLELPLFFAGRT